MLSLKQMLPMLFNNITSEDVLYSKVKKKCYLSIERYNYIMVYALFSKFGHAPYTETDHDVYT